MPFQSQNKIRYTWNSKAFSTLFLLDTPFKLFLTFSYLRLCQVYVDYVNSFDLHTLLILNSDNIWYKPFRGWQFKGLKDAQQNLYIFIIYFVKVLFELQWGHI